MSKKKKEKVLVLKDGTHVKVLKESGKYYVCDRCMFRKNNPDIRVEEAVFTEEKGPAEEEA